MSEYNSRKMNLILVIIIGWISGVFVNYISDIFPVKRRFVKPFCLQCHGPLSVLDFLFLRKCNVCGHPRKFRYWIVEVIYILASLWLWYQPPDKLGYIFGMVVLIYFGVVFVIDLEHRLIMHPVSLVGAVLCLGIGWHLHGLVSTLIGGGFGFIIFLGLYYLGDLFARWVSRLRRETLNEVALGFGDVNLSGVLGLLLGWPGIAVGLVLAIFLGGAVSLLYLLGMFVTRRYRTFAAIPYGPFLIASAFILVFLKSYLN